MMNVSTYVSRRPPLPLCSNSLPHTVFWPQLFLGVEQSLLNALPTSKAQKQQQPLKRVPRKSTLSY